MGEEITITRIEVFKDCYQIDMRFEESKKAERTFIRKDALFALICVAEKNANHLVDDHDMVQNNES